MKRNLECCVGSVVFACLAAAVAGCGAGGPAGVWDFEPCPAGGAQPARGCGEVGTLPPGWSIRQTRGTGPTASWSVIADDTTPGGRQVLALARATQSGGAYNLAIAERYHVKDVDVKVLVKGVEGEEDQGGGPIWRCLDEKNYYICRVNPLESNYRVYKVIDGKRTQLASARVDLEAGRWYLLRARMVGDRIECYLDGTLMLEATDDAIGQPGMIGLWTKADAVTSFDLLYAGDASRDP